MSKIRGVTMTPVEDKFLEEMKEKHGWGFSYIIHRALDDFRKANELSATMKAKLDAIDLRARRQAKIEQGIKVTAKELRREDAGRLICDRMEATIVGEDRLPDPNGGYCLYNTYQCHRGDSRILTTRNPLEYLTEDMVATQYSPDRKTYEAFCRENNLNPKSL